VRTTRFLDNLHEYKIGSCYFFTEHASLRSTSKALYMP